MNDGVSGIPAASNDAFTDLSGRVALVTGGGRGIGRATSLLLAHLGASVVVNDIGSERDRSTFDATVAEEVVTAITSAGGVAIANHDSVASAEGPTRMVEQAVSTFGQIDILANIAGNKRPNTLVQMSEQEWDELLAVHLKGTFLCTQAACREMIKRGYGRVINISSHSALGVGSRGFSGGSANYAAAKAGVLGLTRAVARELEPYGITCNALFPNAETRNQQAARAMRAAAGVEETSASLEPKGKPDDVARFIAFLASSAAGFITGRTFFSKGNRIDLFSDPTRILTLVSDTSWDPGALGTLLATLLPPLANKGRDQTAAVDLASAERQLGTDAS